MQISGVELGWKTLAAAVVVGLGAIAEFAGYPAVRDALVTLGGAFGLYGLRDAIAKK